MRESSTHGGEDSTKRDQLQNSAFADGTTILPSAACAAALIDRLVHRREIITIEGESFRKR